MAVKPLETYANEYAEWIKSYDAEDREQILALCDRSGKYFVHSCNYSKLEGMISEMKCCGYEVLSVVHTANDMTEHYGESVTVIFVRS